MNNQIYQVYADTFFKTDLIDKLKQLEDNQKPLWGIMTPQHMVEHIIGSWLISNGRFQVKLQTAAEKLTERRNFLFSDKEFQQNVQSAEGEPGKLNKLRKDNLLDAIISLQKEIITFYDYHNENPKKVKEAVDLVIKHGGIEYTHAKMLEYKEKALELLTDIPASEAKNAILGLVEYTTNRKK